MAGRGGARACWNRPFSLTTGRVWRPSGGRAYTASWSKAHCWCLPKRRRRIGDRGRHRGRGRLARHFLQLLSDKRRAARCGDSGARQRTRRAHRRTGGVDSLACGAGFRRITTLYGCSATVSVVCEVRRADRRASDRPRKPGQRLHPGPHRRSRRARRICREVGGDRARHHGWRRRDDRCPHRPRGSRRRLCERDAARACATRALGQLSLPIGIRAPSSRRAQAFDHLRRHAPGRALLNP